MKKKHYLLIAVFSYLFFLITAIPASTVVNLVNSNTPVNMQGIGGTIWEGEAALISINKTVELNNTKWSFTTWKLLLGQIAFQVTSEFDDRNVEGEIGVSFLSKYFINDLTAMLSAEKLASLANIPLVQLSGDINFNLDHAHWEKDKLPLATGLITWTRAAITVADTVSLGKLTITLSENDQQLLLANIKNIDGDLSVNGQAELIPEASYSVDIKLTPTASTSDNIKSSLSLFAKKQKNGDFLFKNTGQLNQLEL
jgi:general secretion pathway protein N